MNGIREGFYSSLDRSRAEVQERLSALTVVLPTIRKVNEQKQEHVSVQWLHARKRAETITNWRVYPGIRTAGRTPKGYPEAAIIALSKAETDAEQARRDGSVHAVAYKLGSTVMVGAMLDQEIFGIEDNNRCYRVAMGIGKDALTVTAGLWTSETRELWVPNAVIEDGGRVSADAVPIDVPFL
jgi:hypothetical protein